MICRFIAMLCVGIFFAIGSACVSEHSETSHEVIHSSNCSPQLLQIRLIHTVLNEELIYEYFHFNDSDLLSRVPLNVICSLQVTGMDTIQIRGFPVKFVEDESVPSMTAFRFIDINVKDDTAFVKFMYEPEGIFGDLTYSKVNCTWRLVDQSLQEN